MMVVNTRGREVETSLSPYPRLQPFSAPPLRAEPRFVGCADAEQSPYFTPPRSARPLHFGQANTAPPAARCEQGSEWGTTGDQPRKEHDFRPAHELPFLALRDDSVAISSTADTQVQESYLPRQISNGDGAALNAHRQLLQHGPGILYQPQHTAGLAPESTPHLQDQSPLHHRSTQLHLSGRAEREDHSVAMDRINHVNCNEEIAQLAAQNADLKSQLQSCTEQVTAMHGRVQQTATERHEQANQVTQLREWLDDVRSDRNRLEVRLMAGSGTAQQDTRSDLEDAVLRLGREKSSLQAAVVALQMEQRQSHEYLGSQTVLEGRVRALETRLQRQRSSRQQLESHMKDLYADYTTLQRMHGALEKRCSTLESERDKLLATLKERDERCATLKERTRSKAAVLEQVRNAAQALVQDKQRVATQLADAVMQQSRIASDNARLTENVEQIQGGLEEVVLAMDVFNLRHSGTVQPAERVQITGQAHIGARNGNATGQGAPEDTRTLASNGQALATIRQLVQWLEAFKTERDAQQALLAQAQREKQQLEEGITQAQEERQAAQQELLGLHKQADEDKRRAGADIEGLRQASEDREARVKQLERDLNDAAREVDGLLRDKDNLSMTVETLQTDLLAERRLNEEMQSILDSFRGPG